MAVPEYEDGVVFKVDIPVVNGIDITDYKKIPKSVDYFFDIKEDKPKYIANLNKEGYGFLHTSTKRLRSRKLFSWGNGQASDHWQEFLTDKAGRYVEIQAGLGKTQCGCVPMAPHTAWERMEKKLKETAPMAKSRAKLVTAESGYGALAEQGQWTKHLEFTISSNSLEKWKHFLETGVLHKPDAKTVPEEFLIDSENLDFLVNTLEGSNQENWYAHYQEGIGYFSKEDYEAAEKLLRKSYDMEANPWFCHAMACICLITKRYEAVVRWIQQGLSLENKNLSYLKEGLKILYLCEANKEIVYFFEKQDREVQEVGKLRFYYISALYRLGENRKAYGALEKDGGLIIADIREGRSSVPI